ncbi:MAG: phosphatase [Desulfurobacterium sp.]|nr:MAG: phosphatase [Desulfurobacterium sp.]
MDSFPLQKVDLHSHSTASDGSLAPREVVKKSKEKGIYIFSLTDHDTVCGVREAIEEGKRLGVKVIPGIEVTADTSFLGEGRREFHILGYYVDIDSEPLKELTTFFQDSRKRRNEELLSKLEDLGYNISYEEMVSKYGTNFGKPNIAKVLIDRGYFQDREEAIDFLSSLKVKRKKLDYREITRLIDEAGGIAVIAHPVSLRLSYKELYCFLKCAKNEKISGLEIFHYNHKPEDVLTFREMCESLDLYFTGGSDFHGENKPCIELGFINITVSDIHFPI